MDRIVSYNDASDIDPDGVAQIERFLFSGTVVDIAGMGIQGIGEMVLTLILEIIRVGGGFQMSHRHSRWLCFSWPICRKVSQTVLQLLSGYRTRQSRDLTGTLIADIVLQLLSYAAQTEREFIRQRQAEGIAAAKCNGVKFGRRPMDRPAAFDVWKRKWLAGEISAREAARQLGVTHSTFLRWVKE